MAGRFDFDALDALSRARLKRGGIALGIAAGVGGLITLFIGLLAPEAQDPAPMPLPAMSAAAPLEMPPLEMPPPSPEPPAEAVDPPAPPPTPPKVNKPERRVRASAPPPPPPPPKPKLVTKQVDSNQLKVKFRSVADLADLSDHGHVTILLEVDDDTRYVLPRTLDTQHLTSRVSPAQFSRWVETGRVSELVPTAELHERLDIHRPDIRYLAVLDDNLVRAVVREAEVAALDPKRSVLLVESGPKVTVAVARR